jgi:hypothetical protein
MRRTRWTDAKMTESGEWETREIDIPE